MGVFTVVQPKEGYYFRRTMNLHLRETALIGVFCWICWSPVRGQKTQYDTIPVASASAKKKQSRPWLLSDQLLWIELDAIMNPIYVTQFSTHYKLNGQLLHVSILPRFYAVTPAQLPFGNLNEILDQSNAAYLNFRMLFLDHSPISWLHNTRLVIGATHDKLQTGSDSIHYKYDDGGTEFSVMLEKHFFNSLSDLDFNKAGLIFSFNVQYGLFLSLAQIKSNMSWKDTTITQEDTHRWIWGESKPYIGGWGWLVGSNVEIGRAFGFFVVTLGSKFMTEGLYSSDKVIVNNVAGNRLRVNNYGLFFAGPMINLKFLIR